MCHYTDVLSSAQGLHRRGRAPWSSATGSAACSSTAPCGSLGHAVSRVAAHPPFPPPLLPLSSLYCPLAGAGGPATKESLEEILEALPNINDVTVSRSIVDEQGGYEWLVTFVDPPGDVPQLTLGTCTWHNGAFADYEQGCWGAGVQRYLRGGG
jgi:hypothetical protein